MYEILTKLRQIESSQVGRHLVAIVKFRNDKDGIVDVHIQGPREPAVCVERSGDGYKAFASDGTWVRCDNEEQVFGWTLQRLAEIMGSQQLS